MNFLRRKARPEETATVETQRIIHRETQITVEREWVAVGYPPPHPGSPPGRGVAEPEVLSPGLPPTTRND